MWYGPCFEGIGRPFMSIQLPRNQKELHFTGSVKALAPERPAPALGRERPKGPLPLPIRTPAPDVYVAEAQPTPYVAARPSERAEAAKPLKLTTVRGQLASMDDDAMTEALDRDLLDAALFPVARRANAGAAPLNLPVPHFRSAAEARAHHAPPALIVARRASSGGLPLSVWLIAALVSGIVSYQVAPQAAASLTQAVRGTDGR
jgi:hypothetical protein